MPVMVMDKLVCKEIYGTRSSGVLRKSYVQTGAGQLQVIDQSGKGTSIAQFFRTVFLPQGYPHSVSGDYLEYQLWDTVQAFCSSITGALATQALLQGAGVGDETATVLAATLTWLMKDGTGMLGRIVFAWMQGSFLDSDCKRWRLFADILNDAAICLEIIAPYFQTYFRLLVCTAGLAKSIVGVAGGATRAALTLHQARRNNMADVSAKDGSQETLVNLIGLICNLLIIPMVAGHHNIIGLLFLVFTSLHLMANYKAVKSVCMESINQARLHVLCHHYLLNGRENKVLSVKEGNLLEPVLWKTRRKFSICLGTSMQNIITNLHYFQQLSHIYCDSKFLLHVDLSKMRTYIVLAEDATDEDQLSACFEAEVLEYASRQPAGPPPTASKVQWQDLLLQNVTEAYRHGDTLSMVAHTHKLATHGLYSHFQSVLKEQGWKTQDALLSCDEWRAVWDPSGLPDKKSL